MSAYERLQIQFEIIPIKKRILSVIAIVFIKNIVKKKKCKIKVSVIL